MIWKLTEKKFPISQKFGNKLIVWWSEFYKKFWLNWHNWIDLSTPTWTKLLSCVDWIVDVNNEFKKWYWLSITIKRDRDDWYTYFLYAHLSNAIVKDWDKVKQWQVIWYSGWSPRDPYCGNSFWPHLHFW